MAHKDETIFVVKRTELFGTNDEHVWQGLQLTEIETVLAAIQEKKEFHSRSLMEEDPRYKQIIPYLIFKHDDRYFLMQRHEKASEKRLRNKLSLGIGGHVRAEDLSNGSSIFDWAHREFHEEIDYTGKLTIQTLGLLNDDSNAVGRVHLGLVLLVTGDTSNISVRSELKGGRLVSLGDCREQHAQLESWSQIVVDHL